MTGATIEMPRSSSKVDRALLTRIREIRRRTFGDRGRARFARAIGLPPSTYRAYESSRLPPVGVLLRMHRIAGVDLRWLLTGQFPIELLASGPVRPSREQVQIVERFGERLAHRRTSIRAMTAMLDLLDDIAESEERVSGSEPTAPSRSQSSSRIPIMGRTAAGVAYFWSDGVTGRGFPDILASAPDVLDRIPGKLSCDEEDGSLSPSPSVHLERLLEPRRVGGVSVCEFLIAPGVRRQVADAFALRVDGDSMSPMIEHGDLVIVSPSHPARPGRPAVVQLRRQIGVTCKLFRTAGSRIRLIPINEHFPTTTHQADQLIWALAVLFRVRLLPPAN